jgi:3-phosphoshikimate 1-carboxyvinyltransferase
MSDLTPPPIQRPFELEMSPPGSKSLTNRALVLAVLAEGRSVLRNVLVAEDTQVMLESLSRLGFVLRRREDEPVIEVEGRGGEIPSGGAELYCGNSGTTIRFLLALCALGRGSFTLDGNARMRERPIGRLVEMLHDLAVRVEHVEKEGYPPVRLAASGLPGGILNFGPAQSSQYLSAILQVAPYARNEVRVELGSPQTSWPYVEMTMRLMDLFGVTPELMRDPATQEPRRIIVPQQRYRGQDYSIEPDASNASYFLAAAAVNPGSRITINGLGKNSLQGDVGLADLLHQMGADLVFGRDFITIRGGERLSGIDADLSGMPDVAQTLAVVALFAEGETCLRGLHTLRVKETDRLAALRTELGRLGAEVEIEDDTLCVRPPHELRPARIATYDDHRMAMSFAVASTRAAGITLCDIECVNKTYPGFFGDFARLQQQE